MTTQPIGQPTQSEPAMGQKPRSEGHKDPPDAPVLWPWEDPDDEPIDAEEVTDDQIEENVTVPRW
jgi:hypothetical protein